MELDFEIDKITESIERAGTGESFATLVLPMDKADLKQVAMKNGWRFKWRLEFLPLGRQVYKLVTEKEPEIIHGLISLEVDKGFIFMHLIENAPFNVGKGKLYDGVCGNLVAYACKISQERGFDGLVAFRPKTKLIEHYERTLGAIFIGNGRWAVPQYKAEELIERYFSRKDGNV